MIRRHIALISRFLIYRNSDNTVETTSEIWQVLEALIDLIGLTLAVNRTQILSGSLKEIRHFEQKIIR